MGNESGLVGLTDSIDQGEFEDVDFRVVIFHVDFSAFLIRFGNACEGTA